MTDFGVHLTAYLLVFYACSTAATEPGADFLYAKCGESVQAQISTIDEVQLTTDHLLDASGSLPAGCTVEWRINLKLNDTETTINYGLLVEGNIDLVEAGNTRCRSSNVEVTDDEGEEYDAAAVTEKFCGTKQLAFKTYEDMVRIILTVPTGGVGGKGFDVTVKSFYACGGTIDFTEDDREKTIKSPDYAKKKAYPTDTRCMWTVKWNVGEEMKMKCPTFELAKKKSGACPDTLQMAAVIGKTPIIENFCYKMFKKGKTKSLGETGNAVLEFKSDSKQESGRREGFVCNLFLK